MSDDADKLDRRLARLLEEGRQEDPNEHPAPAVLSAYYTNELSPEEADAIQEHLAECTFCADLLLDLESSLEPPMDDRSREGVADLAAEAGWRRVRAEMGWKGRSLSSPTASRGFFASARGGYSVAAALLVAAIGLAAWNLSLLREIRSPQPIRSVRTLEAWGSARGSTPFGEEGSIDLPAEIILSLPTEDPEPLYRVDLLPDGSDRPVWSRDVPPQGTALNVFLPRKSLPSGRYTLRVSGFGQKGSPNALTRVLPLTYELSIGSSGR